MSRERAKILQLLAEGRLTVEQAERLLDLLREPGVAERQQEPEPSAEPDDDRPPRARSVVVEKRDGEISIDTGRAVVKVVKRGGGAFRLPRIPRPPRPPRPPRGARPGGPNVEELIELAIHGVKPAYLKELREAGLRDLEFDEVLQLAIHGVKADYVRRVRELLGEVSAEKLAELRIHGIDPAFIERIVNAGVPDLSVDEIIEFKIHGVDPELVAGWRAAAGGTSDDERARTEPDEDEGSGEER